MAGLMAATTLAQRDVVLLEAADTAAGRDESVRYGDYWTNVDTQFTAETGRLIDALERNEIPMGTLEGTVVALSLGGKEVDTTHPFTLITKSRMTVSDRLGLARVGGHMLANVPVLGMSPGNRWANRLRAKLDPRAATFVLEGLKSGVAHLMVRPVVGCEPEDTAATQFEYSMGVLLADPAKVPTLSLPEGGNQKKFKPTSPRCSRSSRTSGRRHRPSAPARRALLHPAGAHHCPRSARTGRPAWQATASSRCRHSPTPPTPLSRQPSASSHPCRLQSVPDPPHHHQGAR